MTCPSIGLDPTGLGALAGALGTPESPPPPPVDAITAVLAPASSRLYDGQSVADMTGFATFTAPGNFASTAGGVASVVTAPLGTAPDVTSPLAEGDTAGYRVTVTDTAGNSGQFDTAVQTVEYDVRVISTSDNEVEVVLNELVPDAESVDLDITHAPYTGLYSVPAGSLRQAEPFVLPGTHRITHGPDAAALTTGDVLFMQDPLAHTIHASLSVVSRAWLRGGTPIAGATGATYQLVAADLGATLTPRATVQDNLGNQTVSDGLPVSIEAPLSAGIEPVLVDTAQRSTASTKLTFPALDLSGVATGTRLLFMIGSNKNAAHAILDVDLTDGATPVALTEISPGAVHRCRTAAWILDKPAGYDAPLLRYSSSEGGVVRADFVHVYAIDGAAAFDAAFNFVGGNNANVDGSIDVQAGAGLIVAHHEDRVTYDANILGVSGPQVLTVDGATFAQASMASRAEAIAADETPRTITGSITETGNHSILSIHARTS